MKNYSFIYHPLEKLHGIIPDLLPGIEKIITVHYDDKEKMIKGILSEKRNKEYESQALNLDKILTVLQRYMEEKNPYDWYSRQSLPFEIEIRSPNPTMNIFSELQNIVLLIRVPDFKNELNDLVFFYLNENPSNFGVTNTINPLTTDNKSIIAFILNNTIRTFINLQNNDKETLKFFNNRTRQIIAQTETLKYELQRTKENYGVSLVRLCKQIVHDKSIEKDRKYSLSYGALEKIKNYKGDIKDLETIINESIAYAESLFVDEQSNIEIKEWHILTELPVQTEKAGIPEIQQADLYGKSVSLLDKLENAALVVTINHLKLTGTNVGKACPVPISAPAISDALYNHKSKINKLLKMYPDKWETIRNDFRPLKNILKDQED